MDTTKKIPVTILTGFLGSGKTTLLNRILSEQHGKRIAVIENEYGEVGIDQGLIINADEEIFEMSNGCICCTVRGDLIRILGNLIKRRDKFDYVLVETTGLADPGPVAQTFFMDDEIASEFSLDGIVTLVDSYHIQQQLNRSQESLEQIAFADVILLNKTDLVKNSDIDHLENKIQRMNRLAKIYRCQNAKIPISTVLNLEAFDLDQILIRRPNFLEPEYPFEWSGVYDLSPGEYKLCLNEGPDPLMSLVLVEDQEVNEESLRASAEYCVRHYANNTVNIYPNHEVPIDQHVQLKLEGPDEKFFLVKLNKPTNLALFAQHTAEEFNLRIVNKDGLCVPPISNRLWVAQHEHDNQVSSVAIELAGDVNSDALNKWLGKLLRERGVDIFRMKGFISIAGEPRRFVFQGVHMLFDGQPERLWGEEERRNQLVFIGRNLDHNAMRQGFQACLN